MSQQDKQSDAALYGFACVLGYLLISQAVTQRTRRIRYDPARGELVGVRWSHKPTTAFGVLLQGQVIAATRTALRNLPGGRLPADQALSVYCEYSVADAFVGLSNSARPLWPWCLLATVLGSGLACVAFIRRLMAKWSFAHFAAAAAVGVVSGGGLILSVPLAAPQVLRWAGLSLGALEGACGVLLLGFGCLQLSPTRKRLAYGPKFTPPTTRAGKRPAQDDGIFVGRSAKSILPKNVRWTAGREGDIVIPFDRLSCGVTILGEKGSGKSRLLFSFHDAIRKRYPSIPILIHDPKGEWFRTYFDPDTDLIFAPHFQGTSKWSIWGDFKAVPQLRHELIATAVYAHQTRGDSFWMDQAISLLSSVSGEDSLMKAAQELAALRSSNKGDKFWLSVFGTAQLGLLDIAKIELDACRPQDSKAVKSIKDYFSLPTRIFLLNDPACSAEQKGAFSLFLSAFLLYALSLPDLPADELRAVAIVDEALTFNLPEDVDRRIYALCRSKGVSLIAGAQRLPDRQQGERGEWQTAEYLFGMKVISQDTQKSLSMRAGQISYEEDRRGLSVSEGRVARSENEHADRTEAIPPEHFGRLAQREFILFHDTGLITGITKDALQTQGNRTMPAYDARNDVLQFSRRLHKPTSQGDANAQRAIDGQGRDVQGQAGPQALPA